MKSEPLFVCIGHAGCSLLTSGWWLTCDQAPPGNAELPCGSVLGSGSGDTPAGRHGQVSPSSPSTHMGKSSAQPGIQLWGHEWLRIPLLRTEQVKCHLRKAIRTDLSAGRHHLSSHAQAFFSSGTAPWLTRACTLYRAARQQRGCGDSCVQAPSSPGFFGNLMGKERAKHFLYAVHFQKAEYTITK